MGQPAPPPGRVGCELSMPAAGCGGERQKGYRRPGDCCGDQVFVSVGQLQSRPATRMMAGN